jgi:hypothetical protein
MMKQNGVAESPKWTRPEDYVEALVRQRTSRRASRARLRTQPEAPRLLLSTVPFLAIMGLLAVLAFAIMVAAMPSSQAQQRPARAAPKQEGVAARGWFQEAQKDFHG